MLGNYYCEYQINTPQIQFEFGRKIEKRLKLLEAQWKDSATRADEHSWKK